MTTLYFDIIVSGDKEKVWNTLADFAGVSVFHPIVRKSYAINGTPNTGLGAERTCELSDDGKKFMNERIVRFVDGKEFDVEVSGGNQQAPVNNLIATVGIESLNDNLHRIYLKMSYQPKFSIFGKILDLVMIKPLISKSINAVLVGFKHHIETGQPIQSVRTLKAAGLLT